MTKLIFDGNMVFIRMLSHQLTGQVVWYSIDASLSPPARRVPVCCPDLDYVTYAGPAPSSLANFWSLFKQYQLIYSQSDAKFETGVLAAEFVDHMRLERAKCYATHLVHATAQWAAEKNGLVENPLHDTLLESDQMIKIIAQQHNISAEDAAKLWAFKSQEHQVVQRNLRYAQIESEMAIVQAQTTNEVIEAYKRAMTSFARVRVGEQTLTKFL